MKVHPKLESFAKLSFYFAKRELKNRSAGNILGLAAALVQPLVMILVFIFLFSVVFKVKLGNRPTDPSFTLFMVSGFIPWAQFQETVARNASSIIENRDAIKKISFPVFSIVAGNTLAIAAIYAVPLLLLTTFCLARCIYLGLAPASHLPLLAISVALAYACQIAITLGFSAIFASLSVYIRDVLQVLPVLLQVWFYATPIIYPLSMVPERFRPILKANPWTLLLECYRTPMLNGMSPHWNKVALPLLVCSVSLLGGYALFKRLKEGFNDVL